MKPRIAVVGGGWAGLAAAVAAVQRGAQVSLFEMAPTLGGRARSTAPKHPGAPALDNGQHILIGAYSATLDLMRTVGVDPEQVLLRRPLSLVNAHGQGLRLPQGPALIALTRGVLSHPAWTGPERLALLARSGVWALRGFRCDPRLSVAELCRGMAPALRRDLIDPLCVAALNTPADQASAEVFLRVLRDALFSGPGAADLLLPKAPLAELLPHPAQRWLEQHGATITLGQRVEALGALSTADAPGADGIILACSALEAARLTQDIAPTWSREAAAFGYEPIVTVNLQAHGLDGRPLNLAAPMVQLPEHTEAQPNPAQFVFDQGQIQGQPGRFSFVISGAAPWVERGQAATLAAIQAQAKALWPGARLAVESYVAEKRATFRCTPGLHRPAARPDPRLSPRLVVAGDYIEGPYPATLEGAVRSGQAAAHALV
ncbi:hydroxysqualene dehydroxylase HpnE [Leptothrix ochracea]|uniref:hydroxysqualene dehydroxylase HpnE n=1 Tax=Leptothrix ochracea TaxID=735331 RepID=UPI0034E2C5BD